VTGRVGGSAGDEIDAPPERVWAVIEDVMAAPDWQGGLDRVVAVEHDPDGRPMLVDSDADVKVRRGKSRVRIRYERPPVSPACRSKGPEVGRGGVGSAMGASESVTGSTPIRAGCWDWSSVDRCSRRRG